MTTAKNTKSKPKEEKALHIYEVGFHNGTHNQSVTVTSDQKDDVDDGEKLEFYRDGQVVAMIKNWYYMIEVFPEDEELPEGWQKVDRRTF